MRREHSSTQTPGGDQYLFNFPLTSDGLNHGNLPESQYIPKLRNYGSTSTTASFNDNLTFDTTYGELAHKHTNNTDKLVSLIDYSNFDFGAWMNNNDFELNLDFYFKSYSGYQQVLEMMRNPNYTTGSNYSVGFDCRYTNSLLCILWYDGTTNGIRLWTDPISQYVTNSWVRFKITKQNGVYTASYTDLSNNTVINTKTDSFPSLLTGRNVYYLTVFGTYEGDGASNNTRYVAGATKNLYMKKL